MKYFSDFLFTLVMVALFIAAYHAWVVMPMISKVSRSQKIYVLDLDAVIKAERDRGVVRMIEGEDVAPEEVVKAVKRRVSKTLSALPAKAVVLDSKCVLKGGVRLGQGHKE